jgi:hypothetical protein
LRGIEEDPQVKCPVGEVSTLVASFFFSMNILKLRAGGTMIYKLFGKFIYTKFIIERVQVNSKFYTNSHLKTTSLLVFLSDYMN